MLLPGESCWYWPSEQEAAQTSKCPEGFQGCKDVLEYERLKSRLKMSLWQPWHGDSLEFCCLRPPPDQQWGCPQHTSTEGCKLGFSTQTDHWQPYGLDWKFPQIKKKKKGKVLKQALGSSFRKWKGFNPTSCPCATSTFETCICTLIMRDSEWKTKKRPCWELVVGIKLCC